MLRARYKTLFWILSLLLLCDLSALAEPAERSSFTLTGSRKIRQLSAMHKRAERFVAQNKIHRAVAVYSEITLMEPDDEVAYANMGNCYLILGDFKRAENSFENALAINPENETAVLGLKSIRDPDSDLHGLKIEAAPTEAEVVQPAPKTLPEQFKESSFPQSSGGNHPDDPRQKISGMTATTPHNDRNPLKIQEALRKTGLYTGPIDGQIGPSTKKAIQDFQRWKGLAVDGIVGPQTWSLLEKYLES